MKKTCPARSLVAAVLAGAVLALAGGAPAFAHEQRATGGVRFVVGWGDEPAYTGFKNSVQVTISDANGAPVTDAGDGLRVEVTKASESVTLPLQPNFRVGSFGTPGDYRAWLTPTRPGSYTFRVMGTVRGETVDETFTSGPGTFNDVEDVASIQFPAKDPTPGELATRIEREFPRLTARTETVEAELEEAAGRANAARTLAVLGLLAGAAGLVAAGAAIVAARRRTVPGDGANDRRPGARAEQAESRRA